MITNVQSKSVAGGVLVTWTDADTDAIFNEVWASVSGGAYTLIATVIGTARKYTDTVNPFATTTYKIRKKTEPLLGPFSGRTRSETLEMDKSIPMIFTISLTEDTEAGKRLTLPISNLNISGAPTAYIYNFTVDWGDGTRGVVTAYNDADRIHNYATIGTYQIAIHGVCQAFRVDNNAEDRAKYISADNFTSVIGLIELNFHGCNNFNYCDASLSNVATITSLQSFIQDGTSFQELEPGIFDGLVNLTNLYRAFRDSDLRFLRQGLLDYTTKVEILAEAFWSPHLIDDAVPNDLLYNLPLLSNTCGIFDGHQSVIPPDFIKYNPLIKFAGIMQTQWLTKPFPAGFYDNALEMESPHHVFMSFPQSSLPSGLFSLNKKMYDWRWTFAYSMLTSVPHDWFENLQTPAGSPSPGPNFDYTFMNCAAYTGNLPPLWLWYPTGWSHTDTFKGCVNAANYADVPNDWKGL